MTHAFRRPLLAGLGAVVVLGAGIGVVVAMDGPEADPAPAVEPTTDELSYTLGYVISHRLAHLGVELDVPAFADGFRTARSDSPLKVTPERMQELLDQFVEARQVKVDQPQATPEQPETLTAAQAEQRRREMARQMQAQPQQGPSPTFLRIDGQVPTGRVEAGVDATRRATREADAPDLR